ncbi:MAG TPA: hypothetical protein VGB56_06620 [Flavisolibacter sp.]
MKNTILSGIALLTITASASAQTDSVKQQAKSDTAVKANATVTAGTTASNLVTLDTNLPEHLKGTTSTTIQPKHYLPVLGTYATADGSVNLNVVVDETNMGIVWIEGLPQGRVKGLLKKGPATYKIPAQKTADGKAVAEGTLVYDKDTKQLSLCTGCAYNESEPATVFTGKAKGKVWQLNKVEPATIPAVESIQQ